MTTGIRLLPKHWHRGAVVNRIDARELNETLEKLMAEVRQVILDMMGESVMDIFSIQERLKRKRASAISFLEFCEQRTKIRQYGKADDSKERYNRFMRFFSTWGKIRYFEDVTDANILALDEHLVKKGLKPYSKWNNYHRFLNSFILDAIDEGFLKRNPYKWIRIDKEKSKGGIGKYLSPLEFAKVRDVALPSECLQRLHDFDVSKIKEVKGMKVYVGNRAKTKQTFTIPLLSPALAVLKKYQNKLPVISNVKYNEYLKVIAQAAGIDKPVSIHWARHTGATLLLNEGGMDLKTVAKICGHSSFKITEQVYANMLDDTVVDKMAAYEKKLK